MKNKTPSHILWKRSHGRAIAGFNQLANKQSPMAEAYEWSSERSGVNGEVLRMIFTQSRMPPHFPISTFSHFHIATFPHWLIGSSAHWLINHIFLLYCPPTSNRAVVILKRRDELVTPPGDKTIVLSVKCIVILHSPDNGINYWNGRWNECPAE